MSRGRITRAHVSEARSRIESEFSDRREAFDSGGFNFLSPRRNIIDGGALQSILYPFRHGALGAQVPIRCNFRVFVSRARGLLLPEVLPLYRKVKVRDRQDAPREHQGLMALAIFLDVITLACLYRYLTTTCIIVYMISRRGFVGAVALEG